jgi:hypothetical protein
MMKNTTVKMQTCMHVNDEEQNKRMKTKFFPKQATRYYQLKLG